MIYVLANTHASAERIARLGKLERGQWAHLLHQEQLMGLEAPNVVVQDNATIPEGMLEVLDSRSARYWSEFDLEKGKVTPWT